MRRYDLFFFQTASICVTYSYWIHMFIYCTCQIWAVGQTTLPVPTCLRTTRLLLLVAWKWLADGSQTLLVRWLDVGWSWSKDLHHSSSAWRSRDSSTNDQWFVMFSSTMIQSRHLPVNSERPAMFLPTMCRGPPTYSLLLVRYHGLITQQQQQQQQQQRTH